MDIKTSTPLTVQPYSLSLPHLLRLIAEDIGTKPDLYKAVPHLRGADADLLRRAANTLEMQATFKTDDVIAELIMQLRAASDAGQLTIISAAASAMLADTLLKEGAETTDRLVAAGVSAAHAERKAENENVLRRQIQRALLDQLDEIKELEAENAMLGAAVNFNADVIEELEEEIEDLGKPQIMFVFVPPEIGGFTPAQASNIALAVLEHMEA